MILLIGGTTEAREFSEFLNNFRINYFYCAATSIGASLINNNFISSNRLSRHKLKELVINKGITHIFDLTHPYATSIKKNASKVAEDIGIPYIFYNRSPAIIEDENIIYFNSIEEIVKFCTKTTGNIFLTTGCNKIDKWKYFDKSRLFVRTLPTLTSIKKCNEIGIEAKNIYAAFGPFSYEENHSICKRLHIEWLVTKESGKQGGYSDKINAALDLGIVPLVLKRPELDLNGLSFNDLEELVNYAQKELV